MPKINFQIESSILSELASVIVFGILGNNAQLKKTVQINRFMSEELAVENHLGVSGELYHSKKNKKVLFKQAYLKMDEQEKQLFQIWQIDIPDELILDGKMILNVIPLLDFIKKLKTIPGVSFVSFEKNYKLAFPPNDSRVSEQHGLDTIQCTSAWRTSTGKGIVVAVVDTGIHSRHEDIVNQIFRTGTMIIGRNFTSNPFNDVLDDDASEGGHGTHMAGIIAAERGNQGSIVGVAPDAKIMPLKAFRQRRFSRSQPLADAIYFAMYKGAHIINNSWYYAKENSQELDNGKSGDLALLAAIRLAIKNEVVCVFAAGNDGDNIDDYWVVREPSTIVVAASKQNDGLLEVSNWSKAITIAAPGQAILSLMNENNDYIEGDGTSMAAAHVSGAIALYLAKMGGSRIHADLIKNRLRDPAHSDVITTGGIETAGGLRLNCHRLLQ